MTGAGDQWDEHRVRLETAVRSAGAYPEGRFAGRGVVICGGGWKYLPGAYVCVRMLRELDCRLPVQLWHLGGAEMPECFISTLDGLAVELVDATQVRAQHLCRRLGGWELKCYAVLHCPFQEVLLLDADNVPAGNPQALFDSAPYRRHGAIFWPDRGRLEADDPVWEICGLAPRQEPEIESGQLVVDKARCWKALLVAMHMNEWSDFYYRHMYGDKETFHLAWRKVGQDYALAPPLTEAGGCLFQHDFAGGVVFQHRTGCKWDLLSTNARVDGFVGHDRCVAFLEELLGKLRRAGAARDESHEGAARRTYEALCGRGPWLLARVSQRSARVELLPSGVVINGGPGEQRWRVEGVDGHVTVVFEGDVGTSCRLKPVSDALYLGHAAGDGRMPVVLRAD